MEIKRRYLFFIIIFFAASNSLYSIGCYSFKGNITAIQIMNENCFRIQINNDYDFSYYQFMCDLDGIKMQEELQLSKNEIISNYQFYEKKYEKELKKNNKLLKIVNREKKKLLKKINKKRPVDMLNTTYNYYSYSKKEQSVIFTNDDGEYIYNSVFIKKGKTIEKKVYPGYVIGVFPFRDHNNVVFFYNTKEDISFVSLLE